MINFTKRYNRKDFQLFLKEFLPKDYKETTSELLVEKTNNYFKKVFLLGTVKSLNELAVIEVERIKSEKSRITITKELFKFLEEHGYSKAIVITFSEKESHYRFSLINSELIWTSDTKVKKIFKSEKIIVFTW